MADVIYVRRTQMTHVLEDLTHEMEGQPPKKEVIWVLGTYIIIYIYVYSV